MTPDRPKKDEEIFESALRRAPEERDAYLTQACEGDESLRTRVETLIESHERAQGFVEASALDSDSTPTLVDDVPFGMIGRRVGSYKLVREIGRGGMGSVYLAIRADDEYQKQVAIKLIKRGMDTDFIIRRFRHERQILATLDHPYIAHLLDGGTTDDGLPYFVLEYIEGKSIYHYCDALKLNIPERIKLFRKVCAAVQYAHQQLVIHRDIKPGNILVTADGTPKLLDFGIAKILNPEFASQTLDPTTAALRMMTPEYASPEQVRGEPVTTESDIYTLGVMLYELLTDHRPYRLRNRFSQELARIICEEEPERPSVIVGQIEVITVEGSEPFEVTPDTVARARSSTLEQLRRQLSGSLDNIILKAMRKESERRYQSVEEFSEDLRRYLEGQPVQAPVYLPGAAQTAIGAVAAEVRTDEPTTSARSIAVLPFKVLRTEEKGDEFLGMGLTDAIITKLSNIHRIMVRPTSSVLKYFDGEHNAQAAGYELQVSYVLDGRIQRAGDRVRVTVQLVRVRDGAPFWAAKFDESFTDIFSVEDSISGQVAEALIPRLTGEERELLNKRETENANAYQAYLKGRYYWNKFTDESLERALEQFQEAIRLDPNYALAHVGVADYYNWAAIYHMLPPKECYALSKAAAIRALQIDDGLAEAYATLASATLCYDWDWTRAEQMFKRSLELNANNPGSHEAYSYLLNAEGRFNEGLKAMRRAAEINPLSVMDAAMVSWSLYQARRYDQVVTQSQRVFEIDPDFGVGYIALSAAYERQGMKEEAIAAGRKAVTFLPGAVIPLWVLAHALATSGEEREAREILASMERLAKERYVSAYHMAIIHTGLGEPDEAFKCLEKAYEDHDPWMIWLGTEPKLDPLRSDARFVDLLVRVGLDEVTRTLSLPDSLQRRESLETRKMMTSDPGSRESRITDEASAHRSVAEAAAARTALIEADRSTRSTPETTFGRYKTGLLALVVMVVLTVVAFGLYKFYWRSAAHFQTMKVTKLTATGNLTRAAISPDGKYVVYVMDEAGRQGLWVRQLAVANSIRIVAPADVDYRGLTFSHDGIYIYYVVAERGQGQKGRLFKVPALGGSGTEVRADVDSPVSFSPDGKRLAFVRSDATQGIEMLIVANADGSAEQQLASRKYPDHLSTASAPVWSPDGQRIAYGVLSSDERGFYMKLAEVRVADKREQLITPQRWLEVGQAAYLADGSGLVLTAQDENSSVLQLWYLSYPGGEARRFTNDLSDYRGVSLSADSHALLTVQSQTFTSIWMTSIEDTGRLTQISSGAGRYVDLSWTAEGTILYGSDASGTADIWEMNADGSNQRQLTAGAGRNYAPVASPDGRFVLFHSNRSGIWQIWRMNRDGSNAVRLTDGKEGSNWPQVSTDSRWVIYEHIESGTVPSLWKIPIEGGAAPVRLTDKLSVRASISPDGRLVAYWEKDAEPNAPWRIGVINFEDGRPMGSFDIPQSEANGNSVLRWTRDGRGVIYIDFRGGVMNLFLQPLSGGAPEQLTKFTKEQFYSFDLARDGRLIFTRGLMTNDILLISDAGK